MSTTIFGKTLPAGAPEFSVPTPERLGGKERFLLLLSTDKPIYKPGETIYARAVMLRSDTFFPMQDNSGVELTVTGPRYDELFTTWAPTQNSTTGFTWDIPHGTPGGRYKASVTVDGFMKAERSFEVRVYNPPRLKSQIEFMREGYGPGDEVAAVVNVKRAEGGVPEKARVTAIARVDEAEVARVKLSLDKEGNAKVSFKLPKNIERGEGTLAFMIEDGGVVETATKTIPILLQTLDIAFYPEGGELVAGLPGRVYVQALRPDGKPADLEGEIILLDKNNNPAPRASRASSEPAARLTTTHEGRGIMEFTPQAKGRYALRLLKPSGITRIFPLPEVTDSGVAIKAHKPSYAFEDEIKLDVRATEDSDAAWITLYHRERLVAQAKLKAGQNEVSLKPDDVEGVLIATVWNKSGKPLAERLVFREPKFKVQIGVGVETIPAGSSPTPGSKVRLKIETKDEKNNPVEAVVGLVLTDDAVLEMVEKRDQAPSLPVMVYLENEVKDLADAHVYFDPKNPEAARQVDLLLGTQGWRRFVLSRLDDALKNNPEDVRRALAIVAPAPDQMPMAAGMGEFRFIRRMAAPKDEDFLFQNLAELAMEGAQDGAAQQPEPLPSPEPLQDMPPVQEEIAKPAPAPAAEALPMAAIIEEPFARARIRQYDVYVREYAHKARPDRRPNDRVDFTETLYWNAGIRTNPRDGLATVEFDLSDSVTSFRLRADAFGNNGALGETTHEIASLEPFYIEPKFPPEVVTGDRINLPVALVNSMPHALDKPAILARAEGLKPGAISAMPKTLSAGSRSRALLVLEPDVVAQYLLTLNATAGGYTDSVTRPIKVLPRGFPVQLDASGMLGPTKPFGRSFTIASEIVPGSMRAEAKIYPTPLANLEEALNALLRSPYGCFEQTSSTSFPLVMAQQYFLSHPGVSPEKIKNAEKLLDESYKRLIGFESKDRGYEWFGDNPGHEALTAYGLMQFTEMKKVMAVDSAMVERTRNWLMARRDGKGGFERNTRALDSFGAAPVPLTNLYILWTLLESGENPSELKAEINAAKKLLGETKDPYLLALGANIMYLAGEKEAALAAAKKMQTAQNKDGYLTGAETSITRSGGDALKIETTSLAIISWLRLGDEFAGAVEQAMSWLFENCKAGRFGSTQSTILVLKAINAYDAARSKPKAPGKAQLKINGKPFGNPIAFDKDSKSAIVLPDFSAAMTSGEHRIELAMEDGADMPFVVTVTYNTPQPASSDECPLLLSTRLSSSKVKEGELVDLKVRVEAKTDTSMPLAVIGMPAGLEPRHERLKELASAGQIASYEIIGRELVLYWRVMKGNTEVDLSIPFTANIPGIYTGSASRAYAFYLDEHKHWVSGEKIEIEAK
ncbi:MAG: hypothetical protein LBE22_09900 [Azoarcus sp.]|jgi:uncharacterized protein YfaS (alpha-2-macroglobulin family)|nr:hypothetical protein [Azoarcus sp.]